MKHLLVVVLVAVAAAAAAATAGAAGRRHAGTTVAVKGSEFRFVLSRTSAPHGLVTFVFTNAGKIAHDFKIAGKVTKVLEPHQSARLTVTLKKGKYAYLCTVPGHAAAGMKGFFTAT